MKADLPSIPRRLSAGEYLSSFASRKALQSVLAPRLPGEEDMHMNLAALTLPTFELLPFAYLVSRAPPPAPTNSS